MLYTTILISHHPTTTPTTITQELLARMGMPLQQCRQSYQYMTPSLRSHFAGQMQDESILEAYNLINPGVAFKVFI